MRIKDWKNKALQNTSSVQKMNTEFCQANYTHNVVIFKDLLFT